MSYKTDLKYCDNPNKFRPAAVSFQTNGFYCSYPKGTTAYRKYWDEEFKRCVEGFTSEDDEYISGYFYFYLNYCQIILNKSRTHVRKNGKVVTRLERIKEFPEFRDYDRLYFEVLEQAEDDNKHLAVLKKRKSGYSFKGASMVCRNFYFIRESTSVVIAEGEQFLTQDGILSKAWDIMAFIDKFTPFGKKKQAINQALHKRASVVVDRDGIKVEEGYKSEIIGISAKGGVDKIRGIRCKLIIFEEGGIFKHLKAAWQIARSSVENDDGSHFGMMICQGTASSDNSSFEALREIFYEPQAYNCLEIDNIWDEGANKACGFFVPQYTNMEGNDDKGQPFMDEFGNSNILLAKAYEEIARTKIRESASDRSTVDRYIIERPFTPSEALLIVSANIFPKTELLRQLSSIKVNKDLQDFKQIGELHWQQDGTVKWELNPLLAPITKWKLSPEDSQIGSIVIYEQPVDNPPYGLYIAGVDPYDFDQANSGSLGSCIVYKRFSGIGETFDVIVAEYTARPTTAEQLYENVRKLLIHYNSTLLYENEKIGLNTYFKQKHCEHLLADQPNDVISHVMKNSTVDRKKGIHMNSYIKRYAEQVTKEWLNEEFEPGRKNLTRIYCEPLLEELINYNESDNFDRAIALFCTLLLKEQLSNIVVRRKSDIPKIILFEDGLFKDSIHFKNFR
jgi:hypothetical protein